MQQNDMYVTRQKDWKLHPSLFVMNYLVEHF